MSRGTQLPDLFEGLPSDQALREFQHELVAMRSLCLQLLENKRLVARSRGDQCGMPNGMGVKPNGSKANVSQPST
jgi:hypothetical protein